MTRTRSVAIATVLALGLTLTACNGDDEPTPIPDPTDSPTPAASVSPPPDNAPDLDDEQQAAFDAAVKRYADYQEFSNRVWEEPSRDPEVANELAEYTVMPETKEWSNTNEGLIEKSQHITGSSEIEWTTPVEVTEDRVTFTQCLSPGDWKLHEGEEFSEQTNNIAPKVFMVKDDGVWLIEDQEFEEEC